MALRHPADRRRDLGRPGAAGASTCAGLCRDPRQFGQPIGKFQGVSFQLADMITEIDAADWLTLAAAWRLDQGLPANREIASAKLYASEMLARVTDALCRSTAAWG
jgi:alkylation response protein AidB-like acyl-CoA dehydrogenase